MGSSAARKISSERKDSVRDKGLMYYASKPGGLIEQENAWAAKKSASDGNSLLLAARQAHPAFPNACAIAVGERADEVVRIGVASSLEEFLEVCTSEFKREREREIERKYI